MRDLEKDLEFVGKEFKPREPICLMGVDMWVLREWLERAIKAEAEVERLQIENAKLRAAITDLLEVVEILHPKMDGEDPCICYRAWEKGRQALAEPDEEGE